MALEQLLSRRMNRRDFFHFIAGVSAGLVACNGTSPPNGNGPPPSCDLVSARDLAVDYGLPDSIVDVVSNLGDICDDDPGVKLITNLLPNIQIRSNEVIARSYAKRYILDDNVFDDAELLTMTRFFEGRKDREGLLVHPGYFELVDNGHVMIPRAEWMPIFGLPLRFNPFPAAISGGKALPILEDQPYLFYYFGLDRSLTGSRVSWQELSKDIITPEVSSCNTDLGFHSMQLVFNNLNYPFSIDKLEVVNPLQVPVRIKQLGFFYSLPNNERRNAHVTVEPVSWPASLGHPNLIVTMSHLDDEDLEDSGLKVGDVIPVEGRIGRVSPKFDSWRLILGYRSDHGFYREGHADRDSRFKAIDVFDPQPNNSAGRGLVPMVLYESVDSYGNPEVMNLATSNSICQFRIGGKVYFGHDPIVPPMKYYFP